MWLLLLVVFGALYLSHQSGYLAQTLPESHRKQKNAQDVLDERYARGELDTDEYESMKATLTHNQTH
ncbi:SHOCT domain-containing protein [sulfur-oxidizing endosymbiont of Gigantopelta aegis]|uniref:SHOCT domain-containing protein n=1 Tax=sulfur-oxidizing endosymbiont of Gigantopelta aegis TaxID=2794934 RepID=UPI001BE416CA|nr:SHOCT domain-containing protein [sulfur-oxidizing endosymbiont of Gigantopelta aegis]